MQHSEVPHILDDKRESIYDGENKLRILKQGDKVIYGIIRFFMNQKTRDCYPSIKTIKEYAKCGYSKINEALMRLIDAGLITVTKKKSATGKISNVYHFPENEEWEKKYERFTEAFLQLDIPINIKEYYMDMQPYIIEVNNGRGYVQYNNATISGKLGLSVATIKKYNTWLIKNDYLTESITSMKDESGLQIVEKSFNLEGLNQIALWAKTITKQVEENTRQGIENAESIEKVVDRINKLEKENAALRKRLDARDKEDALKRNSTPEPINYAL